MVKRRRFIWEKLAIVPMELEGTTYYINWVKCLYLISIVYLLSALMLATSYRLWFR